MYISNARALLMHACCLMHDKLILIQHNEVHNSEIYFPMIETRIDKKVNYRRNVDLIQSVYATLKILYIYKTKNSIKMLNLYKILLFSILRHPFNFYNAYLLFQKYKLILIIN